MEEELPRSKRNRRAPDRYSPLPFNRTSDKNISESKELSKEILSKNTEVSQELSESVRQVKGIETEDQYFSDTNSSIVHQEVQSYNLNIYFISDFMM